MVYNESAKIEGCEHRIVETAEYASMQAIRYIICTSHVSQTPAMPLNYQIINAASSAAFD